MNKRKRSTNFSNTEKELLLKIVLPRLTVLENKTSNAVTWKHKENAWKEITDQFNSQTLESPRSTICLNQKYDNIKKKIRITKTQLINTGDSQHYKHLTELELELLYAIQVPNEEIKIDFSANTKLDSELFNAIKVPDKEIKFDSSADIKQALNRNLNKYDASTSDNISNLKTEKRKLLHLQKKLVNQELEQSRELHRLKIKHLNEEHKLRMMTI